jgi:hypothetical protein
LVKATGTAAPSTTSLLPPAPRSLSPLATPEWRRPDDFPGSHGVYVTTDPTTAAIVAETVAVNVTRLGGAVAFDTRGGGGRDRKSVV